MGKVERESRPHLPQLDALRTFAVLAVMLGHFAPAATESLPLGEVGVRLFCALSGFLITGTLIECRLNIRDGADAPTVIRRFYAGPISRLKRHLPHDPRSYTIPREEASERVVS
jgi:peptidoglycan/LPS O-acetylase OafA/YrhL